MVDDNESKALCKLCDVKLLRGKSPKTFSSKPLWNHLKSAHNTQHDLIKLSKGDKTVGADVDVDDVVVAGEKEKSSATQPDIATAFANMTPFKPNSTQAQAITKAIGEFCFHLS